MPRSQPKPSLVSSLAISVAIWIILPIVTAALASAATPASSPETDPAEGAPPSGPPLPETLRLLLVIEHECADLTEQQATILKTGLEERIAIPVAWTVVQPNQTRSLATLFQQDNWADQHDLVIHQHAAPLDDRLWQNLLLPHSQGIPAILLANIHQPHPDRAERTAALSGARPSTTNEVGPFTLQVAPATAPDSWINEVPLWDVAMGKPLPQANLLTASSPLLHASVAHTLPLEHGPVAWTHPFGPAHTRVFSTTLGRNNREIATPEFLDLLARSALWALKLDDRTRLNLITPETTKVLMPPPEAPPQPSLGRRLLTFRHTQALHEDRLNGHPSSLAQDGDLNTLWQSELAGPTSWWAEIETGTPEHISDVLLHWSDQAPVAYTLDVSTDLKHWQAVVEVSDQAPGKLISSHPIHRHALGIRLTVNQSQPGQKVGLRELAIYPDTALLPAAWVIAEEIEPPLLLPQEESGVPGLKLAQGYSLNAATALPEGFLPTQLIVTAANQLLIAGEQAVGDGPKEGAVYLGYATADGEIRFKPFLSDLRLPAPIAWDGSRLYLLQGHVLSSHRAINGFAPADDPVELGAILTVMEEDGASGIIFHSMSMDLDGSLIVHYTSPNPSQVFDREGQPTMLSRHGLAKVSRDGSRFISLLDHHDGIVDYLPGASLLATLEVGTETHPARVIVESCGAFGKVATLFPRKLNPVDSIGLVCRGNLDRVWLRSGDELRYVTIKDNLGLPFGTPEPVAHLPDLAMAGEGPTGDLWAITCPSDQSSPQLIRLSPSQPLEKPVNWRRVAHHNIPTHLESLGETIRVEARFEWARRRRQSLEPIKTLLQHPDTTPWVKRACVMMLSQIPESGAPPLSTFLSHPSPDIRAAACAALALHPPRDHEGLIRIIAHDPSSFVRASAFTALIGGSTASREADTAAIDLLAESTPLLNAVASAYLVHRAPDSVWACLESLDAPHDAAFIPSIFSVLSRIPNQQVVESIAEKVRQTDHPDIRMYGLDSLARLYRHPSDGSLWAGSETSLSCLQESLLHPRVNQRELLRRFHTHQIPLKDLELLTTLALRDPSLASFAVDSFIRAEATPQTARPWLESLVADHKLEPQLQSNALTCLLLLNEPAQSERLFPLVAQQLSPQRHQLENSRLLTRWLETTASTTENEWLKQKTKHLERPQRLLAWATLLSLSAPPNHPSLPALFTETIQTNHAQTVELLEAATWHSFPQASPLLTPAWNSTSPEVRAAAARLAHHLRRSPATGDVSPTIGHSLDAGTFTSDWAATQGDAEYGVWLLRQATHTAPSASCPPSLSLPLEPTAKHPPFPPHFSTAYALSLADWWPEKSPSPWQRFSQPSTGKWFHGVIIEDQGGTWRMRDVAGNESIIRSAGWVQRPLSDVEKQVHQYRDLTMWDLKSLILALTTPDRPASPDPLTE